MGGQVVGAAMTLFDLLVLLESFTADHKPLMGEAPEVRGFFLGCGFNSAGKRETYLLGADGHLSHAGLVLTGRS